MPTKHALLGLLNIKEMSAYDLAKFARESIGYFWNESYSNVHRTLDVLTSENLVTKSKKTGGRNKTVYRITAEGQQTLKNWLSNHEHSMIYRDELLLKLFVSQKDNYPSILIDFKKVLEEISGQQRNYHQIREFLKTKPAKNLSHSLVLDYGIIQNDATIKWLKKAIKQIGEEV